MSAQSNKLHGILFGFFLLVVFSFVETAKADQAYALLDGNIILRFDTATPTSVNRFSVTGLGAGETLRGIDFRPSTSVMVGATVVDASANNSAIKTYTINTSTGAATLIGTTAAVPGAADVATGFDFNPVVDRMRYVNVNDENVRLNPNNGTLSADDTDLTPGAGSTIIGAAYDRNSSTSTATTLYVIDRNDNALAIVGGVDSSPSPNTGVITEIGPLGITLNAAYDGGFDIASTSTAYAALSNIGTGVTGLYTINLSTGAATLVGAIDDGTAEIFSLAIATTDTDSDGVRDAIDNCASTANADQADTDADGTGDSCDSDIDGDGLSNTAEAAIGSDPLVTDSDGDTLADGSDACPALPASTTNGCPSVAGSPPETSITKSPKSSKSRKVSIAFTSTETGSTFECSLENAGYKTCRSPKRQNNLRVGRHKFKVRAITSTGIVDLTPASASWTVKR